MQESDWWRSLDGETENASFSEGRAEKKLPCLTILCHPDGRRVGERALLPMVAAGSAAPLSRLEPLFAHPGGDAGKPLGVRHLSRRPLILSSAPEREIDLLSSGSPTSLVVDGTTVKGKHRLTRDDLARGAVLLVGQRIVLLLHLSQEDMSGELPSMGLVGRSDAIQQVRREVLQVASTEIAILLRGETGTGKELVARAIHQAGPRRDGPFVAINMGAVPPPLAAAELFGSVKGAFTGAEQPRAGFFRRADGGTLFLDEIGELPREIQPLLLRALENGEVQPVGSDAPVRARVRVIAATDSDLEKNVQEGRFGKPLLHRLGGYEIHLPPLRERREDFGRLLYHFLRQELARSGEVHLIDDPGRRPRPWLPARLVARLASYDWPGNVRQLRNVAQQLVITGRTAPQAAAGRSLRDLLDEETAWQAESAGTVGGYRSPGDVDEEELLKTLEENRWNPTATAKQLGISRASLYVLIDASPRARKASDLSREEIEACYDRCDGQLGRMSEQLEVSEDGLKRRMRQLAISP